MEKQLKQEKGNNTMFYVASAVGVVVFLLMWWKRKKNDSDSEKPNEKKEEKLDEISIEKPTEGLQHKNEEFGNFKIVQSNEGNELKSFEVPVITQQSAEVFTIPVLKDVGSLNALIVEDSGSNLEAAPPSDAKAGHGKDSSKEDSNANKAGHGKDTSKEVSNANKEQKKPNADQSKESPNSKEGTKKVGLSDNNSDKESNKKNLRSFKAVKQDIFPRLIRISAQGGSGNSYSQEMTTTLVPLDYKSLNTKDMFILDNDDIVYQWGHRPSLYEKSFTAQITRALDDERDSAVTIHVLENLQNAKDPEVEQFWKILGISAPYSTDISGDDSSPGLTLELFVIDPEKENKFQLVSKGKKVKINQLKSEHVFLLDTGFELFVWIGKLSNKEHQKYAKEQASLDFIQKYNRPAKIKITVLLEGAKDTMFDLFIKG